MFGGRRRALEERIELLRLDLARIEGASSLTNLLLATLVQQGHRTMSQLSDIAARIDTAVGHLSSLSQAPTPEQVAELSGIARDLIKIDEEIAKPAAKAKGFRASPGERVTFTPPVATKTDDEA